MILSSFRLYINKISGQRFLRFQGDPNPTPPSPWITDIFFGGKGYERTVNCTALFAGADYGNCK